MDACCRLLHGHAGVWYATTIEVVDYLNACRQLYDNGSRLTHAAAVSIWIHCQGRDIELAPGIALSILTMDEY
jgi:hypothetical protein